jgi:enoyl-CoA hydratase
MSSIVKLEKDSGIATVTLNRPEALNALSRELRKAIVSTFRELQADEDTRVVILTGAGRAFCAGMDLKELAATGPDDAEWGDSEDPRLAIEAFEGPIIGAINGYATTAGFELALACDVLIASTQAKFADTHARVGMIPGWGLSVRLPRLIGINRAKEISFTGNFITAEQAEKWGLVNRVVPSEDLLPVCRKLAEDMASCDAETLVHYKKMINEGYGMGFAEALSHESALAVDWAKRITATDKIAARREDVFKRGRKQDR